MLLLYALVLSGVTVWTTYLSLALENSQGLYVLWLIWLSMPLGVVAFFVPTSGWASIGLFYALGLLQAGAVWALVRRLTAEKRATTS